MKKRSVLALTLVVCIALLSACASTEPEHFQVLTAPTQAPAQAPKPEYDPAAEEGRLDEIPGLTTSVTAPPVIITAAPTVNSVYAGASPVVIDPIDKPSPSPAPEMAFAEYVTYDATRLGLSFQAPAGWVEDASATNAYTIVNPDPRMAFKGYVTLQVESVKVNYSKSQLTAQVKSMLSTVRSMLGGTNWSPTNTASRDLLDAAGVYADFTVTLTGGVKVAGRVQAACLNNKLYMVYMVCPADYYSVYKTGVYNKLRQTIAIKK